MEKILFNSRSADHSWLSNFHPVVIHLEGVAYPSVEHAYQAAKTLDPAERRQFRGCTASQAKHRGQRVTLRQDWTERLRLDLMYGLTLQKFAHLELRTLLLNTGTAQLIEDTPDPFWGRGKDGLGFNYLGRNHMRLRAFYRHDP